jgi:hypothetical protein
MIESTINSATALHPRYITRRQNEVRALMHHTLGTLFVLAALILIVNV